MSRSRRSTTRTKAGPFFEPAPTESIDVGHDLVDVPIRYYRTDCFLGIFAADHDAVAELLPSDRLFPVRLKGGRAAIGVVAYNYSETGVGPYGEIGIAALCTFDRAAKPMVPLLRETADPRFGAFVLHLPVTSRIARDAGRTIWGYPKFVADMTFDLRPERRSVEMCEQGRELLGLEVRNHGKFLRDNKPVVTFSEQRGQMVRTVVATRAEYRTKVGHGNGRLELGDHEVAQQLRELDISTDAMATKYYLSHAAVLPKGETLCPADEAYEGFAGSDAPFGRHVIRYDEGVETIVSEAA
ncbi:MAG TPA: acetoacetate decarboxylase family protein, partial [Acidimicrobiales bacterium]|nr:acetoacetate decarboxylase family protein [Acidimicrobiales bacterium]